MTTLQFTNKLFEEGKLIYVDCDILCEDGRTFHRGWHRNSSAWVCWETGLWYKTVADAYRDEYGRPIDKYTY